jgi:transposase
MQYEYLTDLLEIKEFFIVDVKYTEREGKNVVVVYLQRINKEYRCSGCGELQRSAYDSAQQEIQHLMLWNHPTYLNFYRCRVYCFTCGIRTEALDFVTVRGPRVTKPLASLISELCKVMSNKAVGALQGLHRHTVKEIDKQAMQAVQLQRSLEGISVLGVDEIAIGRGHNYWTMISALEGPRGPELLAVLEGRKEKSLEPFWRWFGKKRSKLITHAVMDMWKAFRNSFTKHCPNVQIIYDKFHIIGHLLKALNEVRKCEMRKAAGDFKGLLAGKKFILLSRQANVRGNARQALKQVLNANQKLLKAHLLKEAFAHLWSYRSKTCAKRFFRSWVNQLKWSRLKSYHKFAAMVEKHLDGILSFCDKKVPLGYIESSNLKARNVIRRAYGYRDEEYMKLKIIQACTPWMAQFNPWLVTHSSVP